MKTCFLILVCNILLFYGCTTCDPSTNLGKLPLTETTNSFVPYTGYDKLVFLDEKGQEHLLTSTTGWDSSEYRLDVRLLCEDWPAAPQTEYYEIQSKALVFVDSTGENLRINLNTMLDDTKQPDSIVIFDWFEVIFSDKTNSISLSSVTDKRLHEVSDNYMNGGYNSNQFLGDTTLYGKPFNGVYADIANSDYGLFYTKEKGVVAVKFPADKYWVLKE